VAHGSTATVIEVDPV